MGKFNELYFCVYTFYRGEVIIGGRELLTGGALIAAFRDSCRYSTGS